MYVYLYLLCSLTSITMYMYMYVYHTSVSDKHRLKPVHWMESLWLDTLKWGHGYTSAYFACLISPFVSPWKEDTSLIRVLTCTSVSGEAWLERLHCAHIILWKNGISVFTQTRLKPIEESSTDTTNKQNPQQQTQQQQQHPVFGVHNVSYDKCEKERSKAFFLDQLAAVEESKRREKEKALETLRHDAEMLKRTKEEWAQNSMIYTTLYKKYTCTSRTISACFKAVGPILKSSRWYCFNAIGVTQYPNQL